MSEFSDRPFVAGSLTGLRAFEVDSLGRLRGVTVPAVFTPGENVAACHRASASMSGQMMRFYVRSTFGGVTVTSAPEPTPDQTASGHTIAGMKCACGYYAYYDQNANPYRLESRVAALIEGYGVCSVGTRGFRAEKARLVALVVPDARDGKHRRWYDRLSDWSYRHQGISSIAMSLGFIGGVWSFVAEVVAIMNGLLLLAGGLLAVTGAVAAGVVLLGKAGSHGIDRRYPAVSNVGRCSDMPPRGPRYDLVLAAYPSVPTYPTLEAALAAHPLTPPPSPTPDEDEFWTLEAS